MDKLEDEDKSLLRDELETPTSSTNIVEEHFKGVLCVTYKCMDCGNESKHNEEFTDILLAFPEVVSADAEKHEALKTNRYSTETKENPKSLKGGDQVRNFQESNFQDGAFERPKENVSNVQTTPKSSTNVSALMKHDHGRSRFTLYEMLDYFMKPEKLSGSNQYSCDQCRANVDGERRVQIAKLPNVLMLSLKRFSFDVKSQTKPKLLHVVDYPEELTFCTVGDIIKLGPKNSSVFAEEDITMKNEEAEQAMDTCSALRSYKLCSVVVHSGHTCEAGHYYSYASDAATAEPQWYCFNDERTHETSYKDFLEREETSTTDTTYIVMYMNDELRNDKTEQRGQCEVEAPAEMVERVKQDNYKYLQVKKLMIIQTKNQRNPNASSNCSWELKIQILLEFRNKIFEY